MKDEIPPTQAAKRPDFSRLRSGRGRGSDITSPSLTESDRVTVNVTPKRTPCGDQVPEEQLRRIRLDCVGGKPFSHEPVELFNGKVHVGRSSHWPITIPDTQMSRKHFSLCLLPSGAIEIEDHGSTNGTFVNGVRIRRAWVEFGDKIKAGHTSMILRQAKSEPVYVGPDSQYGDLYGRSLVMRKVFHELALWANAKNETVLISGETGTGKELAARAIHTHSERDGEGVPPYIDRSCADFSPSVVEAELFGTEAGGFTDARDRPGVFEQAIGGTLFLDEVGELPLTTQSKLLRVIESRKLVRLGGTRPIDVSDMRLITASHRDLREMIDEGTFRKDLYYRLNVLNVHMPPLRDRGEDVRELSVRFLAAINAKRPRQVHLSAKAMRKLERHPWPGNVRELKNVITNAAYSAQGEEIELGDLRFQTALAPISSTITGGIDDHLATKIFGTLDAPVPWKPAKSAFQREYMRRLLEITNHDLSLAARISEYNYDQFRKLVRKHGLNRPRGSSS